MSEMRQYPAPLINPETEVFWQSANRGIYLLPRCTSCDRFHWYPRARCPYCFGEVEMIESEGRGEVYSFSVLRTATPPYTIAYVRLDEGPIVLSNLVDGDLDAIEIGQKVQVTFRPTDGEWKMPVFTSANS